MMTKTCNFGNVLKRLRLFHHDVFYSYVCKTKGAVEASEQMINEK